MASMQQIAGERYLNGLYDEQKIKESMFKVAAIEEAKFTEKVELSNDEIS
jgi:hypothetical protein